MRGAIAFALIVALGGCSREAPEPTVGPGNVCGDPALFGEIIGAVEGAGACGIENAIRLTSVSGVTFSTPETMDYGTAKALKTLV